MTTDKETAVTLRVDDIRLEHVNITQIASTVPMLIQGASPQLSGVAYTNPGTEFPFQAQLTFAESAELETVLARITERILREGVVYIAKEQS